MLTAEKNRQDTEVGSGTPVGEVLRRHYRGWMCAAEGRCAAQPDEVREARAQALGVEHRAITGLAL